MGLKANLNTNWNFVNLQNQVLRRVCFDFERDGKCSLLLYMVMFQLYNEMCSICKIFIRIQRRGYRGFKSEKITIARLSNWIYLATRSFKSGFRGRRIQHRHL